VRATVLLVGLVLFSLSLPLSAQTPDACPGSTAVERFVVLLQQPDDSGQALPVGSVNRIRHGDWLDYSPVIGSGTTLKNKAKVAVVLVSSLGSADKHVTVLPAEPADSVDRWRVPFRTELVGLVVGPDGLNLKNVHSFVEKNPDLMPQLADYAKQTSTVAALIQTLSKYEQSSPGSSNLQSALDTFSTQYGVSLPAIGAGQSTTQQASDLLHALLPATAASTPLTSRQAFMRGSTDLAASVATLFFGSPVGLATGATALFENLRISMFPRTDFRAAFVQPANPGLLTLCSNNGTVKPGTRIAYFWAQRVPDAPAPAVRLLHPWRVPLGGVSPVEVTTGSVAQLKRLARARDWRLVAAKEKAAIPVKVSAGSSSDTLTLDLRKVNLAPGSYRLVAKWDWARLPVAGAITAVAFPHLSSAAVTEESQDRLVSGSGIQWARLTGADFEFVDQVELVSRGGSNGAPGDLPFTLPLLKTEGKQGSIDIRIDCDTVQPGSYLLRLRQRNGSTHDVPVIIHPPNPALRHLPLRLNAGQADQTLVLRGSGMDRIRRITSPGAVWTLAPVPAGKAEPTERRVTIALGPGARQGERLPASLFVGHIHRPLTIPDAIEVVGPLPKIVSVEKSFAGQQNVELFRGEIPAETAGSFLIHTKYAGPHPTFDLACEAGRESSPGKIPIGGTQPGPPDFERLGPDSFFLTLDPDVARSSGCLLAVSMTNGEAGASAPFPLGRVVVVPRIDSFALSEEKEGKGLYVGTITGQSLQEIEKTGWNRGKGYPVLGIPTPVAGRPKEQNLKIVLPWPAPSPRAPLYIWLQGENKARLTSATY